MAENSKKTNNTTRNDRGFVFMQCVPPEACLGGDSCKSGYQGVMCQTCALNYYRLEGRCEPCASNGKDYTLIVIFFTLLVVSTLTVCLVHKYKIKIDWSAVSVLWDFLQILSMFNIFSNDWPSPMREIITITSFSVLNLELAAPECLDDRFNFINKSMLILITPIMYVESIVF